MHILSISKYRWKISKDGSTVLSGIGTPSQAVALAKAHDLVLFKIGDLKTLKAA